MAERSKMLVLGVARKFFEGDKNIFEPGKISAADGDATKSFEPRG
jgi:hypothetical protein